MVINGKKINYYLSNTNNNDNMLFMHGFLMLSE